MLTLFLVYVPGFLVDGTFASVPFSIVRQQVGLALEGNTMYYSEKNFYPKPYKNKEAFFPPVPEGVYQEVPIDTQSVFVAPGIWPGPIVYNGETGDIMGLSIIEQLWKSLFSWRSFWFLIGLGSGLSIIKIGVITTNTDVL
jgi:hypothetical protein